MKANLSLKSIIIFSVLTLLLVSTGVGIYVLNFSNRTATNTSTTDNTKTDNKSTSVAKPETVKSTTVTKEMIDKDGNVDLTKVLQKNE